MRRDYLCTSPVKTTAEESPILCARRPAGATALASAGRSSASPPSRRSRSCGCPPWPKTKSRTRCVLITSANRSTSSASSRWSDSTAPHCLPSRASVDASMDDIANPSAYACPECHGVDDAGDRYDRHVVPSGVATGGRASSLHRASAASVKRWPRAVPNQAVHLAQRPCGGEPHSQRANHR